MAEQNDQNVNLKRNYNRLDFSKDQEEKIISFVKQHPELYNPKHSEYKNKIRRDQLWNDLAKTMDKIGWI